MEGLLEATVAIEGSSIDNPRGEPHAHTRGPHRHRRAGCPPSLDIHTLSVHSQLQNRQLDSELQLASSLGSGQSNLAPRPASRFPSWRNVNLTLHSLGIIELFTADLRDIEGTSGPMSASPGTLRART